MTNIEAMKLVLDALEVYGEHSQDCPQWPTYTRPEDYPKCDCGFDKSIAELRQAIREAEQAEKSLEDCPLCGEGKLYERTMYVCQGCDSELADAQLIDKNVAAYKQAEKQEPVMGIEVNAMGVPEIVWDSMDEFDAGTYELYTTPPKAEEYNPDVAFNDDGTFSLTLPDGDELRIIPPRPESTAEVDAEGYTWGACGILPAGTKLYTASPQREWVSPCRPWQDLTDDEIYEVNKDLGKLGGSDAFRYARAIEAKLKEKNCG